jgi:hypothetical protein
LTITAVDEVQSFKFDLRGCHGKTHKLWSLPEGLEVAADRAFEKVAEFVGKRLEARVEALRTFSDSTAPSIKAAHDADDHDELEAVERAVERAKSRRQ